MPEILSNSLNAPTSTLASGIGAGDSTLTVASGHGVRFPAAGTYRVVIADQATGLNAEVITVGSRSGDVLSGLGRGAEGTTAAIHSTGDAVDMVLTAGALTAYAAPLAHTHVPDDLGSGTPGATDVLLGSGVWAAPINDPSRILVPAAWPGAANLTTVTILVTNVSYFLYVGRAGKVLTTMDVVARVTAAAVTITWAEVGVFVGTPVANANSLTLTRLGFTNVAATYNSTGIKKTSVALTGHAVNDDLWLAFGSQATTPYQIRAGLADDIQSGGFQSSAGRISTLGPGTGTLVAATLAVPWAHGVFV